MASEEDAARRSNQNYSAYTMRGTGRIHAKREESLRLLWAYGAKGTGRELKTLLGRLPNLSPRKKRKS